MLNLKGENSMKVIKTMDGTIQLQKDAHDGKDIIQDIFFETNLISIDSENSKKTIFLQHGYRQKVRHNQFTGRSETI